MADTLEVIKADITEEIRQANRGYSAARLVSYFSENFPRDFTQEAILIAECLADYYRTGEFVLYDYVSENYDPIEPRIRVLVVTKAEQQLLLEKLQRVQDPEYWLYQSRFRAQTRNKWLNHIQWACLTLKKHV